ncbi:hypothetical protein BH11BAC5_BH11BAC5_15540 [soil metagenome]
MKGFLNAVIFLLLFCIQSSAQTNFWDSPNAYFGLKKPGEKPEVFAKGLLADSGIVLGRVGFSSDGKEFYYTYARHWFDSRGSGTKQKIFNGKQWKKPTVLFKDLANPALSSDGKKMFLGGNSSEVWEAHRTNDGWSKPVVVHNKIYGLYNFQPVNSGVYYAGSNANAGSKKDYSTYDFCKFSILNGDTLVESLGTPLNTNGFDGDLFIAPDESFMIISANETPTYECELFISFRKPDLTWTNPQSLGADINSGAAHRFGQYVTPDKKYLVYTKGTSEKDCNFYWLRFDKLLTKLRQKAFQ